MTTTRTRLAGLLAASALVGIVVGLPLILLRVAANPLPSHLPSWSDLWSALTSPDDGTLALRAVTVIAWLAWLFLTSLVALEVVSRVRGVTTPRLPGLGLPQMSAHALVSTALLLFVAAPALVTAVPTAGAQPPTPHPAHRSAPSPPAQTTPGAAAATQQPNSLTAAYRTGTAAPGSPQTATVPYTVRPGDSLWSIADQHLGSGTRYPEIARLNTGVLHGRPGFLQPGTVLQLPAPHPTNDGEGHQDHRVVVQPGDTLSEIAEEELGDAARYPEIFTASKTTTQPRGAHLVDPDLIDVGWTLTIPEPTPRPRHESEPSTTRERPKGPPPRRSGARSSANSTSPTTPEGTPSPSTAPSSTPSAGPSSTSANPTPTTSATVSGGGGETDQAGTVSPAWLLTGLTGGGAVLAGCMLMVLRRHRRNQSRHRRPGRTIAVPEPVLAPVEKSVSVIGDTAAPTVGRMDSVLRRLAAGQTTAGQPMPNLAAVQLSRTGVTLHLSHPLDLPAPWRPGEDRLSWAVDHQVDPDQLGPEVSDQPAPYPLLVTIGASDTGDVWLLNCEQLAVVSVTGDRTYSRDFARYLTAELACNPWSHGVQTDCCGIADEVAAMNPERVTIHPAGTDPAAAAVTEAVATLDRADDADLDVVTGRARQAGADAWPARLLLVDVAHHPPASLDRLLALVADHQGRTGTAVVLVGETAAPRGVVLDVDDQGRVRLPHAQLNLVGLDLVGVGLTSDEALGCAALLAQADTLDDTEIPERPDADGWRANANEAGALRVEHTLPRATPVENLAEPAQTLLDADDSEYTQAAATTVEDLAALAPRVPDRVGSTVEDADPTLDDDLGAWLNPDADLPRLTLLGPVGARTRGTAIARRKPYYTELLAYLATRPHGATPEEVSDAFSITGPRVRNDIKVLRDWLGTNPRTGRKHLPDARDSPAAQSRGIGVYQVEDLLVDADLFRRLRLRGETRGPDGIGDLRTALRLVTGQPFDKLRPGGWTWLYEGDRLDQHLVCAIVDVAHTVTTHSLHEHDLPTARAAAETAALAAPHEEIPRLDLVAVAHAEGHHTEAAIIIRDDVCNRTDDGQPPVELSERSKRIIDSHDWLNRQETAS